MPPESYPAEVYPDLPVPSFRETAITHIRNTLRPGQQQMADWNSGPLAISAVPGAGKSTGMAAAAAIAIARQYERSSELPRKTRRQLIVVTFTRSAAANIKAKIRKYLRDDLSLPQTGFVVHTLHGLALNIASRYPDLSGLQLENSTLITPNQSHRFIRTAVEQWIARHPEHYYRLLEGIQFDGEETERLRRQSVLRTEVLPELATTVIHEAKSSGLSPQDLHSLSLQTTDRYAILTVAAGLYEQYQNLMRSRDFIDYDDMILAALRVLDNESARRIEQNQVFAVFEDEAQDSSPLQTRLLTILATDAEKRGKQRDTQNSHNSPLLTPHSSLLTPHSSPTINLVRVGDPNQAINSTFTPADPIYFRQFCEECDVQGRLATMDQAGRSTRIIIEAANFVLEWVNSLYTQQPEKGDGEGVVSSSSSRSHFKTYRETLTSLPFRPQKIHLVNPDDPQPDANPEKVGRGLELYTPNDIHHTVELLSEKIIELFAQEPTNISAAILVRENRQGRWLAEALMPVCKEHKITLYDVGEHERHSHVPEEILTLLQFCDRPHSPDFLKSALAVLVQRRLIETQDLNALASLPEEFLYPGPLAAPQTEPVQKAARLCRSFLRAPPRITAIPTHFFLSLGVKL